MNGNLITALRFERQGFINKVDMQRYEQLFRFMQPVQTIYWCCPGDPPAIVHRAAFNDFEHNDKLRSIRTIIKGRFQGGSIAYIYADELELYAAAYKRNIDKLSFEEEQIYELLEREGPMNIQLIKQITGRLVKEITPILHKLQEAFLVYEDQIDSEGDRGWYILAKEFPEADLNRYTRTEAIEELIMRFACMNVFVNIDMLRSFYRLTLKDLKEALTALEKKGKLKAVEIERNKGFVRSEDISAVESFIEKTISQSVFVLHRNDYLVKSNEYWLKEIFYQKDVDVLQYILVDGKFSGAVMGKLRNGPYDIEDVVLTIPEKERVSRRDEIISAVYEVNNPEQSPLKRYDGKLL
jgi:hypothetical protein